MQDSERCPEDDRSAVKCPKCGFVSYPGQSQCKKCGYRFGSTPPQKNSRLLSLFSGVIPSTEPGSLTAPPLPDIVASHSKKTPIDVARAGGDAEPSRHRNGPLEAANLGKSPADRELPPDDWRAPEILPAPELMRPWREELSQRVENFRRRRARLRQGVDPGPNLDFDFPAEGGADTQIESDAARGPQLAQEPGLAMENSSGGKLDAPILDALPLPGPGVREGAPDSLAVDPGDVQLQDSTAEPPAVEIVLESPPPDLHSSRPASLLAPQAPLGRRLLAGLADALVLLAGVTLFGLVFWRAGGRVSLQPLNILVLVSIAGFFVSAYFGLFTALTSSTPGLLWMGLEVRNLKGDRPTAWEASWRAFGYLVSAAGLMLGFIWALVDSEGLTWHDRISGTFLAVAPRDTQ